jgi:hypothetical protein
MTFPEIDQAKARRQLEYLGYKQSEAVYLRFFYHSDDPRKQGDKGRKTDRLCWEDVERYQQQGRGAYFVVNGGGHTNADVLVGRALFCEFDDRPIEEQTDFWQLLSLPEPTFQVFSGGKSIQSYWVFDQPIPKTDWEILQRDFLEFTNSDRSLKNPARVLRLAGAWYTHPNKEPVLTDIISESGLKYAVSQMRSLIPSSTIPKPEPTRLSASTAVSLPTVLRQEILKIHHPDAIQVPVPEAVSLLCCCRKEVRDLITTGVPKGSGRNDTAIEVGLELIAVERYLLELGQPFSDTASQLFSEFCQRSGMTAKEDEGRFLWCESKNPSPSCPPEAIAASLRGWYWREYVKPYQQQLKSTLHLGSHHARNGNHHDASSSRDSDDGDGSSSNHGNGKLHKHLAFLPLTAEALIQEINTLIDAPLDSSQVSAQIPVLAKRANYSDRAVWKIYYDRLREIEQESERSDTAAMIDDLLLAIRSKVELHDVLPLALAEPLSKLASWLNMRPETVLITLLTTVSALHHSQTTSVLNRDWDFDVKPNLYAAIVAPPSQKKSPILKAIARKPLKVLEKKAREAYKAALADYNEQEARYKRLSEEEREAKFPSGPPEPPPSRRKVYSFTKTTSEGLREQIATYPQQGLLALPDELASLIKGANQYRSGRGSDEEDLLSFYDGLGETVLRAAGVAGDFDNLLLSILGTIQPVVLQSFLKDCKDSNGKWSRFMFVNQPLAASTMSADGGTFDLTPMLASLYEKINNLPPADYYPERDAFQYYCGIYNELERRRVTDPSSGMSAAWGKAEGRIGKIALNLHVIHELMADRIPGHFIPKARYQEATLITLFSIQQVFYLYNELGESDALATHLTKVINLSRKKNAWITARDVQLTYDKDSRPTPDAVRSWFRELEAMGKGVTEGLGRNLRFNQEVAVVGGTPTSSPTATTTEASNSQPFVGVVGECGVFLEKTYPMAPMALTHNSVEASSQFFQNLPTIPTNSTNVFNVERVMDTTVGVSPTFSPTIPTNLDNSDPDDTPSDGGGGEVSPSSLLSDPIGDGGAVQQMLTSEEVATWVDLAAACQTLEDVIAFDQRLSVLPNHQQTQICKATPDLIERLWQLPEAADIQEEPPTLAQLQALLSACQTLSTLQALKADHTPKRVSEAYKALSDEQQLHVDGLSATAVEYPVFKYVGQLLKSAGQTLVSRALVYIDPRVTVTALAYSITVPVWGLEEFGKGWKEPIQVNRKDLVLLEKTVP